MLQGFQASVCSSPLCRQKRVRTEHTNTHTRVPGCTQGRSAPFPVRARTLAVVTPWDVMVMRIAPDRSKGGV